MKNNLTCSCYTLLIFFFIVSSAWSSEWVKRTSGNEDITDIAFGNGVFVAVASYLETGAVFVSPDGKNWHVSESEFSSSTPFSKIVFGNDRFVAIGWEGIHGVSSDGIDWQTFSGKSSDDIAFANHWLAFSRQPVNDIAFANNVFVIVDNDGFIATSEDGESWTVQTSNTTEDLTGVVYGNNEFVAVGDDKTILRSDDAINWQSIAQSEESNLNSLSNNSDYYSIHYIKGRYFLQSNPKTFSTVNLTSWQQTAVSGEVSNQGPMVAHNGSLFVSYLGQRSDDGRLWSDAYFGTSSNAIAYGNGVFVVVGDNSKIYSSEDGETWQHQSGSNLVLGGFDDDIIIAENRFVVANSYNIRFSSDGVHVDYSIRVSSPNQGDIRNLYHQDNLYIAVTDGGYIFTSPDGISWTERLAQSDKSFLSVTGGDGNFVAVGYDGVVFSSNDGINWTEQLSAEIGTTGLLSVAYGSQGFVVVGFAGKIFSSVDGTDWVAQTSDGTRHLNEITYGHGKYAVAGDGGTHLISDDAVNWINLDTGISSRNYESIAVTQDGFISAGQFGWLAHSTDGGESWEDINLGAQYFKQVIAAGDTLFAYDNNSIYINGEYAPPLPATTPPPLSLKDRKAGIRTLDIAFGNNRFVAVGAYGDAVNGGGVMVSANGTQWQMIGPLPFIGYAIAFHQDRFIVASDTGFYYSYDGQSWVKGNYYEELDDENVANIRAVEYLGGQFIAIGRKGLVMTSANGDDWIVRLPKDNNQSTFDQISFIEGRYVAIGGTKALVSDDGINWNIQTISQVIEGESESINLYNVYAIGERFYAYSNAGFHSSSDGVIWSGPTKLSVTDKNDEVTSNLSSVGYAGGGRQYYANGLFVAFTQDARTYVSPYDEPGFFITSTDGIHWQYRDENLGNATGTHNSAEFGINSQFYLANGNNVFVVVSDEGGDSVRSVNGGVTWKREAPRGGLAMRYLNDKMFVGGTGNSSFQISENLGQTWQTYYYNFNIDHEVDFAFGAERYVAVSDYSSVNQLATRHSSVDGINWTARAGEFDENNNRIGYHSVIFANGKFVAVGDGGTITTSEDGINWQLRESGTTEELKEITFGHVGYIAVGNQGTILSSTDAITWTQQQSGVTSNIETVAYKSGVYVIAGYSQILRSTNGIDWHAVYYDSVAQFKVASAGDLGFLVSNHNKILASNDLGNTWYKVSSLGERNALVQIGELVFGASGIDNADDGVESIAGLPSTFDADEDGFLTDADNCIFIANSAQVDSEEDGQGDACDSDDDNDGYSDVDELANGTDSLLVNSIPADNDGDFISDLIDNDDDNDGLADSADFYPLVAIGELLDTDGDGAPNDCDESCVALGMGADLDDDNDGLADSADTYPLVAIGELLDTDNDGAPDECDESCVALGMGADTDDDGDGVLDADDAYPLTTIGELLDTDNDGAPNDCDENCVALGMTADSDDDNDGILDLEDALPLDASESIDTDSDGIGNNADNDDDGDGLPDTYELANGLDPLDASDAALDNDSDSLSNYDEFRLGTNIDLADTDEDGINDNIDNNPLVFDESSSTLYVGQLSMLPDMNDDDIQELGILKVETESGQVTLDILNGQDQNLIKTISWVDNFSDTTLAIHLIPDMNDNGADEVGLFGVQDTANNAGKPQMFVRDLQTGNRVSVYNWPANWKETSAMVLTDISGDGIAEIGLQGRFREGSRPQLVVKNGADGSSQGTYSYPNLFTSPIFYQHSDADGDGFEEIATFGRITRNNKIQIKIANGINPSNKMKAYNFPDKWDNLSWHRLDDSNSDGIDDWGLFGINKADGRPQLINKDGTDPRGALRLYAWTADLSAPQFLVVPDMNNDGVDEVAVAGLRSNGRTQLQVKDGTDRNAVLANHNVNLNMTEISYHVLADLTGDEKAEIGFLGKTALGGYQLIIREGEVASGVLNTYDLGNDWDSKPNLMLLGDINNDDVPDLLIYGQTAAGNSVMQSWSGASNTQL